MPIAVRDLLSVLESVSLSSVVPTAIYPVRKALAEAGWAPDGSRRPALRRCLTLLRSLGRGSQRWPSRWRSPGRVTYALPRERGVTLGTETGSIEIAYVAPDLIRVRYGHAEPCHAPARFPCAVEKPIDQWPGVSLTTVELENTYCLLSEALIVGVHLDTAQVFVATPQGDLLRADIDVCRAEDGALRHRVALAPGERLFGLGERASPWNRRGSTHRIWNSDPAGYSPGDDPINLNVPVYLGVLERAEEEPISYLAFYDNPHDAEFDLGKSVEDIADHRFAGGDLCYYVAVGSNRILLERYTELTGRHSLQPLWMLGYHQSRWSYDSEERVRKLAADFRAHDVPCDAFHLDIDYMDGFKCFTWNRRRFPDPAALAADLRREGRRLITIIDPGIKRDLKYRVYRDGVAGRHFCTTPDNRIFHAPVWAGTSAFPDFANAGTRKWWGEQLRSLLEAGISGFWIDMNEPSAFAVQGDRTLPTVVQHNAGGASAGHSAIHNLYGMLMARATFEGTEQLRPDRRPVVITRAGWAGVQRYATSWTADNESTWESLALTVPMVLGLGLSGIGFTGADVGGFLGQPDGELFTRWVQMAAFMPFFRAHTIKGSPDQEPWSYGEPFLSIIRRFIELRYELLPYLYTSAWQMSKRGWPIVRPLAWLGNEAALWDVDDAFLCGDALLVAPITQSGGTTRSVRLPTGGWYDFWTNRRYRGGQEVECFSPVETMPLLIREGTILTMGETGPSVERRNQRFLRLGVFPLQEPGEILTELYEDAGEGTSYRSGDYRLSRFLLHQEADQIVITWSHTGAYDPPYEHVELTLNGLKRVPRAVVADGCRHEVVQSDPVRQSAVLGLPRFERLTVTL